jgi:hypothetical protein
MRDTAGGEAYKKITEEPWNIWLFSNARRLEIAHKMADGLFRAEAGIHADARFDTAGADMRRDATNPEDVWRPVVEGAGVDFEKL